jgi:hypothetical protein
MKSYEFINEAESPEAIKASLSPAQLKWLGGADPTDPYIMSRLKSAVPDTAPDIPAANPMSQDTAQTAQAAQAAAPVIPAANPMSQDTAQTAQTAQAAQAAAPVIPAANPMSQDPAQTAQAAAPVKLPTRPGQQTSGRQPDPAVLKLQQDLIAKGAKIKADGIMGPATQAAQKAAGTTSTQPGTMGAYKTRAPAPGTIQQAATPAKAAPPRPGIGMAAQFEWDRQYGKTHNADGKPMGQAATPAAPAAPAAPLKPGLGSSPMRGAAPAQAATPAPKAAPNQSSAETARLTRVPAPTPAAPGALGSGTYGITPPPAPAAPARPTTAAGAAAAARTQMGLPNRPVTAPTDAQMAKSGAPVTSGATNADRRDFEESTDMMRRLSTMLKG